MSNKIIRRPIFFILAVLISVSMILTGAYMPGNRAYAGNGAGSVSASGANMGEVGSTVTVEFDRYAPEGQGIFGWSGKVHWNPNILQIVSAKNLDAGLNPVTTEDMQDPPLTWTNVSPKSMTGVITGAPSQARIQITFRVLKKETTNVKFAYKAKGDGVQANVGDPATNTGTYATGPVPINEIQGLDADGSQTVEVKNTDAEDFNVTYNANGHGTAPASQSVESGKTTTKPTDPTATGYTFEGWYTEAACTNEWNFATDVVTADTTLYAKWTKNAATQYTVTYDANGHGTAPTAVKAESGTTITKPNDPSATGYTFGGWYKDSACTNEWNFSSDKVTADTTLYAKWTKNAATQYTVTYDANGHGTAPTAVKAESGTTITKPNDPSATGYTFGGWYKDSACTNEWNFSSDKVTADTTLYAKWTKDTANKYTVTFDMNGHGTAVPSQSVTDGSLAAQPAGPTATGFTFGGWYKDSACTNAWNFSSDTVTANVTLYAKWTKSVVTPGSAGSVLGIGTTMSSIGDEIVVEFDRNAPDGQGIYSWSGSLIWDKDVLQIEKISSLDSQLKPIVQETLYDEDATLVNLSPKDVSANITGAPSKARVQVTFKVLKIKQTDVQFKYKAKLGGIQANVGPGTYAKGGVPTEAITGWDYAADANGGTVTAPVSIKTIPNKYLVSYNMNGHGTAPSAEYVTQGGKASVPATPNADGYIFEGWYSDAACTTPWSYDTAINSETTIYAKWSKDPGYGKALVTFVLNGGSAINSTNPYPVEPGLKVIEPKTTRVGYEIAGWYTNSSFSGNMFNYNTPITTDITLYAKWVPASIGVTTHNVKFDSQGGTSVSDQTVVDKGYVIEPKDPTKTSPEPTKYTYRFAGWYTSATGNTKYDFTDNNNTVTADKTLYAHWDTVNVPTVYYPTTNILLAKATPKGKTSMKITWTKVEGATKYVIYYNKCNYYKHGKRYEKPLKKVKTVSAKKARTWTKTKLAKGKDYKFRVVAYKGNKKICKSYVAHNITSGKRGKWGGVKSIKASRSSVTLSKGKSVKIKGSCKIIGSKYCMNRTHSNKFRFLTSDKSRATVSSSGKITATDRGGTCYIYTIGVNGMWAKTKVTIK